MIRTSNEGARMLEQLKEEKRLAIKNCKHTKTYTVHDEDTDYDGQAIEGGYRIVCADVCHRTLEIAG